MKIKKKKKINIPVKKEKKNGRFVLGFESKTFQEFVRLSIMSISLPKTFKFGWIKELEEEIKNNPF